jgi:hypothetical protein
MNQPLCQQKNLLTKKPYSSPEIQVYGDFREITNSSTHHGGGILDAGHMNRTR